MKDTFSKIGFILAVAGGAVGLGNAWKFPTLVGQNGGFAFVILYLILTLSIGFAIFLGEILMGKLSKSDPVGAYEQLAPKHKNLWKNAGFLMISGIFVLSFYLVVLGWIVEYIFVSFSHLPADTIAAEEKFVSCTKNNIFINIFYFFVVFLITLSVVSKGIKSGIEKLNIWMMPALFIILLIMLCYSFSMDGFIKAYEFLFYVDFSKITVDVALEALGLAFFTLCLGIGCITTYSASLDDSTNPVTGSIYIVFINILIAIMMGLIVFTFIFEFGADPSAQGPGLIFISLTTLFAKLGILGNILAIMFFIALAFAGLTSAVSMIEPFTFYLINKHHISRKRAISLAGLIIFILGTLSILSINIKLGHYFYIFNISFFDFLDTITSKFLLPLGAIICSIFVGFIIPKAVAFNFFIPFFKSKLIFEIWYFTIRFLSPIGIIIIMYKGIIKG